jgi:hypothetical protein
MEELVDIGLRRSVEPGADVTPRGSLEASMGPVPRLATYSEIQKRISKSEMPV